MKIIHQNPFRIAGVLSNTTERELQRQKTKVKAYAKVGKEISSEYDFNILENITRTEETIDKAFSEIEQNQDKMSLALFWFLNANPFDEIAISHLKNGDSEKALGIWEKATIDKEITSKNFSCFSNISTYKLLGDYNNINEGIEIKISVIESEYFEDFALTVTDKTFIIDRRRQIELFIDELINQLEDEYSELDIFKLFNNCNGYTQNYLLDKFSAVPFQQIEKEIEETKYKRSQNNASAYEFGLELYENTQAYLIKLQSILDKGNLKYQTIADQLANEILQCSIDYYNENQKYNTTSKYLENTKELTVKAKEIAIGKLIKERIEDSLVTLEEMKDREINQALEVLRAIKEAYELNKSRINQEMKAYEETLSYRQTINWSKVDNMIRNSLDWNKVVNFIKEAIPRKNVEIIRTSHANGLNNFINSIKKDILYDSHSDFKILNDKVDEYNLLVKFLHDKVDYTLKRQMDYLFLESSEVRGFRDLTINSNKMGEIAVKKDIRKQRENEENGCSPIIILIIVLFVLAMVFFTVLQDIRV